MEYPLEYVNGIMIVSSVFIAVAGIMITLIKKDKEATKLDKTILGLLGLSMALGFCAIATALNWFNVPTDIQRIIAVWFLFIQFMSMYIPMVFVIITYVFAKS